MPTDGPDPRLLRPGPDEYPDYYQGYVERVPEGDPITVLRQGILETTRMLGSSGALARAAFRYAPEKWSLAEVGGHLADVERVMSFRALHIARGDSTPLHPFDENAYTPAGRFDRLPMSRIAGDLIAVRAATVSLFESLPPEAWDREGRIGGKRFTVRAFSYIIAGHEQHHREIIRQRYLA